MGSSVSGKRPDITKAQLVGAVVGIVPVLAGLLRAFGVYDMNEEQQQALQEAMTSAAVIAGLLFASDAGIRVARNHADAKRGAVTPAMEAPPDLDDPVVAR
jgi:hypothetical protein